ncbi:MAG: serine hydrolase, partial [Bacteroidales bacterium]|nr:serine hydrolase [Bacteroidales bacterium]
VQEGLLSVDDKVVSFFSEDELPAPENQSEWLKQMTIKDLLIMSSGFEKDMVALEGCRHYIYDWTKEQLSYDVIFEPGSQYKYNSGNTYLLSAIITKVTGQKTSDYLETRLFKPLGIKDYYWEESPAGITAGGWGLFLTIESFAKAGQFFLQKGQWNGKQLLNSEWFDEATSAQIYQYPHQVDPEVGPDDWHSGYAYQLWRCTHNAYRMDGAHVQYCIVFPEKNAVVAFFCFHRQKQILMKSFWNHVYPTL